MWRLIAPDPKSFYSASRGSCQRFPNGNTLVTNSDSGQAFELTADFEPAWEYRLPYRNQAGGRATVNRVVRYETEFIDGLIRTLGD